MRASLQTAAKMVCLGLGLGLASHAWADDESVIKYRQGAMKVLGGHMAAAAQIVRGNVAFDEHLVVHARGLSSTSGMVEKLFPEGSDFGETDAKPEIWSKRAEFDKVAQDAAAAADAFAKAAEGSDKTAIGESFQQLSEACKACHEDFRKKK